MTNCADPLGIPFDSISRIVQYNWNDEEQDFTEMLRLGEVIANDENHIFTHLRRVDEWLQASLEEWAS